MHSFKGILRLKKILKESGLRRMALFYPPKMLVTTDLLDYDKN